MKKLREELREELRMPFGDVLDERTILERIKKNKGLLVAVGDVCSFLLLRNGVAPDILIYDLKYMRKEVDEETKKMIAEFDGPPITVKNPAGFITNEMFRVVEEAIKNKKGKIFVDGEEDLAALVAMIVAPNGAIIIYGQPSEGMVFVKVDENIKKRAGADFSKMEEVNK